MTAKKKAKKTQHVTILVIGEDGRTSRHETTIDLHKDITFVVSDQEEFISVAVGHRTHHVMPLIERLRDV